MIRSSLAATRLLRDRGVKYAFGVPGESFLGLLDALYDTPEIDLVTCRHEGGAAFMADAAAKRVRRNLQRAHLVGEALRRDEARLSADGALAATTGKFTGRSPKDKFVVAHPELEGGVDWGATNRPLEPERFAGAVQRAAHAAAKVDRGLGEDDRVTQFELLTAAAYALLADADVEVAVVEAGLGGRYDATNVLPSRVQVLTNVGLEHTRWLGPTVADIAGEKLAVVRPEATLVLGDVDPGVREVAGWVSPVPGGVGPMTRVMLLYNVVQMAEKAVRSR